MPILEDHPDLKARLAAVVKESQDTALRFLLRRLESGDPMSRGPAHFPSTLLKKGPQFPYQPGEVHALMKRLGSLRGHELTTDVKLNMKPPSEIPTRAPIGQWETGCYDDDDFLCDRKLIWRAT